MIYIERLLESLFNILENKNYYCYYYYHCYYIFFFIYLVEEEETGRDNRAGHVKLENESFFSFQMRLVKAEREICYSKGKMVN